MFSLHIHVLWNLLNSRGSFSWIVSVLLIRRDVILWMRRFSIAVTLSKFVFVQDVKLWGELPTNTTKIESSRILMIPQCIIQIFQYCKVTVIPVLKGEDTCLPKLKCYRLGLTMNVGYLKSSIYFTIVNFHCICLN